MVQFTQLDVATRPLASPRSNTVVLHLRHSGRAPRGRVPRNSLRSRNRHLLRSEPTACLKSTPPSLRSGSSFPRRRALLVCSNEKQGRLWLRWWSLVRSLVSKRPLGLACLHPVAIKASATTDTAPWIADLDVESTTASPWSPRCSSQPDGEIRTMTGVHAERSSRRD